MNIQDHSESVEITYDPTRISYQDLLSVFWSGHDPTKEFPTQYASNIFYRNEEERLAAEQSKIDIESQIGATVFTSIRPVSVFTQAEDYHQKYNLKARTTLMAEFNRMYPDLKGFNESTAATRINGFLGGFGSQTRLQEELNLYGLSPKAVSVLLREAGNLPDNCSCFEE